MVSTLSKPENRNGGHRYLRPEDVRRLESFEFAPKMFVEGYLAGKHRSSSRGTSVEFHDYRQYAPGDDPSLVDWRVYARTDRHYLKTFEQETNLECHLLVDSSASMAFGSTLPAGLTKLDYASFFAAALAYLVVRHGDRVSLNTFDEGLRESFAPASTRRHLDAILNTLEDNRAGGKTSLSRSLERALPLFKRRGTVVVISDFYEPASEVFGALNAYLHRGFKVQLFHIADPGEISLPGDRPLTFRDMEQGTKCTANPRAIRDAYGKLFDSHVAAYRSLAARRGVSYYLAPTDRPFFTLFDHLIDA